MTDVLDYLDDAGVQLAINGGYLNSIADWRRKTGQEN